MKIHEYQAKTILAKYGVAVPRGEMALTRAEAEKFARERQKIVDLSPAYLNIHSWPTIWIEEIK